MSSVTDVSLESPYVELVPNSSRALEDVPDTRHTTRVYPAAGMSTYYSAARSASQSARSSAASSPASVRGKTRPGSSTASSPVVERGSRRQLDSNGSLSYGSSVSSQSTRLSFTSPASTLSSGSFSLDSGDVSGDTDTDSHRRPRFRTVVKISNDSDRSSVFSAHQQRAEDQPHTPPSSPRSPGGGRRPAAVATASEASGTNQPASERVQERLSEAAVTEQTVGSGSSPRAHTSHPQAPATVSAASVNVLHNLSEYHQDTTHDTQRDTRHVMRRSRSHDGPTSAVMDSVYENCLPSPPPRAPLSNGHQYHPPPPPHPQPPPSPPPLIYPHRPLVNGSTGSDTPSSSPDIPERLPDMREAVPDTLQHSPDLSFGGHKFYMDQGGSEGCRVVGEGVDEHPFLADKKDVLRPERDVETKIVSSKGTVRGLKNLVRAGIATFADRQHGAKNYRQLEKGRVVIYTTSVMVVRETYEKCIKLKNILQNHMVLFEERDIFMCRDLQKELCQRLNTEKLDLPQLFADGQHLGSLEEVEHLNETGELRMIFRQFKRVSRASSCCKCGGVRYVLCSACHGSKKSQNRNYFTEEFYALRCTHCDENGLITCDMCSSTDAPSS